MKKYISKIIMMIVLAITFSAAANAQLRVKIRPSITLETRPPRPSPHHIWVYGEWHPDGNRYSYKQGYWAEPPQHRRRYVEGHWVHNRYGYIWVPGRWM